MKLIIKVTTSKVDGPVPSFGALQEALESELASYQFEAQNERSDDVSVVEFSSVEVRRG